MQQCDVSAVALSEVAMTAVWWSAWEVDRSLLEIVADSK